MSLVNCQLQSVTTTCQVFHPTTELNCSRRLQLTPAQYTSAVYCYMLLLIMLLLLTAVPILLLLLLLQTTTPIDGQDILLLWQLLLAGWTAKITSDFFVRWCAA